jgi:hypothetical protein
MTKSQDGGGVQSPNALLHERAPAEPSTTLSVVIPRRTAAAREMYERDPIFRMVVDTVARATAETPKTLTASESARTLTVRKSMLGLVESAADLEDTYR